MVSRIKTTTEKAVISEMDILGSSVNQIPTKGSIASHCSIKWQQCCDYEDWKSENWCFLVFFFLILYTHHLTYIMTKRK